jgi:hypothetical protein
MPSTDDTPNPDDPHRAADRTGLLLVDDAVVLYDRENPSGWLRSDEAVALAERR